MPNIDLGKVSGEQGPPGPVAQGTMMSSTYDPNGKSQDVFAYTDDAKQEAKDYAAPATHARQHSATGTDPVTPEDIGAIPNTEKGAASGVASLGPDGKVLSGQLPAMDYAAKTHASQHGASGSDPITPADIGAVSKTEDTMTGSLNVAGGYCSFSGDSNSLLLYHLKNGDRHGFVVYPNLELNYRFQVFDEINGQLAQHRLLHDGNLSDFGVSRIATGSYVGTGVYGENNPNSLTFDFVPKAVFIIGCDTSSGVKTTYFGSSGADTLESIWAMYYDRLTTSYAANVGFGTRFNEYSPCGKRSSDGKTFYWYTTYIAAEYQFNVSGTTYYYLAFA